MKLLIITPIIPFPLDEGGKVSQFSFLEYLQNKVDIHLLVVIYSESQNQDADNLSKVLTKVTIHKIKNYQEGKNVIAARNTKTFALKKIYWKLSDLLKKRKRNKWKQNAITDDFDRSIEFLQTYPRRIVEAIMKNLQEIDPDIIQIEHNSFLNLITFITNKKVVFVEHEIQFGRLISNAKKPYGAFENYKIEINRTIECALLNKYNTVFCFSNDDKKLLLDNHVTAKIEVSPFPIQDNAFHTPTEQQKSIRKIIFVGGNAHYPNHDAIVWYIENVAQKVYEKSGLKFHIIGKCDNNLVNKYTSYEYVIFEGYVNDLFEACTNSIMVVPLRIGSGIRTKILYGMAQHLPIVSTEIGCEGLGAIDNDNIIIAKNASEFTEKILYLSNHQEEASNLGESAYNFVLQNFSQEKLSEKRLDLYKTILGS